MELDQTDLDFLNEMEVALDDFNRSGLSVKILKDIADDYKKSKFDLLDEGEYIAKKIQRCKAVHSVRWRLKSVSHLIRKIVRKCNEEESKEKYKNIDVDNYKFVITDLIGVRALHLFKNDWIAIYNHIKSRWELKEKATIYYRKGDEIDMYRGYNDCEPKVHPHNYRSIHYLIPVITTSTKEIYCEVQTRTIFEEGWSEIDHKVRYPDFSEDENLKNFLMIFNRQAGAADEMGSYVNDLVALIKKNSTLEEDREKNENQALMEKDNLLKEIKQLSDNEKNIKELQLAYDKIIEMQKKEINDLKTEIDSKTNENIRLNRPMVNFLGQYNKTIDNNNYSGTIEIEVTRVSRFASFTGKFDPPFQSIPNVEVRIVEVNAKNTLLEDIRLGVGVGKPTDFNVHLFNDKLGHVEVGTYKIEFTAKEKTIQ